MTPAPPVELQAAVLGLVQGVCEFLPISSSAHLVVLPKLLGWPYLGKGFDVALHLGTLLALLSHFRSELPQLWRAAQRLLFNAGRARDPESRLVRLLVVGSIPAAVAGFFLEDLVEPYLQGLAPIAIFSILWGVLLGWADSERFRRGTTVSELSLLTALKIGTAQALALLPGTSRSGATTTAGLLLGMGRSQSVRFSLLLSIPVVAGAALFKGWGAWVGATPSATSGALAVGIISSWAAGTLCLRRFLAYLDKGDFGPFVTYRVVFGTLLLVWLAFTAY